MKAQARAARRRFARRVSLGLIVLAAVLATCAITFHRMHAIALDENRELLLLETQRRAVLAATWLDARASSFRRFAAPLAPERALDPAATGPLLEELQRADNSFTDLALVDGTGRTLSGSSPAPGIHDSFPWLRDAAASPEFAGGLYPGPHGGVRIVFSRRLAPEGRGMHLRAEADPEGLAETIIQDGKEATWFLLDGHGAALPLGGPMAPGAAPDALALYESSSNGDGVHSTRRAAWPPSPPCPAWHPPPWPSPSPSPKPPTRTSASPSPSSPPPASPTRAMSAHARSRARRGRCLGAGGWLF